MIDRNNIIYNYEYTIILQEPSRHSMSLQESLWGDGVGGKEQLNEFKKL